MKKLNLSIFAACLSLALSTAQAGDKDKKSYHKDKGAKATMNKDEKAAKMSRQVSGQVVQVKKVNLPGDQAQNLVVLIKTAQGNDRLIVDLGNAKSLEKEKISKNTEIKAEGRLVQMGTKQLLVARHLKIGDKTVTIDRTAEMKGAKEKFKKQPQSEQQPG